jgi:hypothetical protein
LASLGWHLGNVIAGVRVQVAEADLERAKHLLATLDSQANDEGADEPARSAVRTSVVALVVVLGLIAAVWASVA